jgi:uncharacterized protein YpmB
MAYDRPDKKLETWISIVVIFVVVVFTIKIIYTGTPKRKGNHNARTYQTINKVNH